MLIYLPIGVLDGANAGFSCWQPYKPEEQCSSYYYWFELRHTAARTAPRSRQQLLAIRTYRTLDVVEQRRLFLYYNGRVTCLHQPPPPPPTPPPRRRRISSIPSIGGCAHVIFKSDVRSVLLSTACPTSLASDQTKRGGSVGCTENTEVRCPRAKDSI